MKDRENIIIESLMLLKKDIKELGYLDVESAESIISSFALETIERTNAEEKLLHSTENEGEYIEDIRIYH
jgi:hypothetical protein